MRRKALTKSEHQKMRRKYETPIFDYAGVVRIRGQRWQVGVMSGLQSEGCRGVCLNPGKVSDGFIAVSTHLRKGSPMYRESAIHETLHAALPKATEQQVRCAAKAVTQALKLLEG